MQTRVKTSKEISAMRVAGGMLAQVLRATAPFVEAGISTKELADIAAKELRALGGKPSFLGYMGFPDVICISINQEIVHGIPKADKIVQDGDLVSLDFGVTYENMITDGAITVGAGHLSSKAKKLLDVTKLSLDAGILAVHDGVRVGDISAAVEKLIVSQGHYGIPRDLVGHGVGHKLWEEPNIPNYGHSGTGPVLCKGMTIAIEPMVTLGTYKLVLSDDGWTISSDDGSWAAHFEHTILITDDGAEILTL
jgi:methionyl aminopeptidase